MKITNKKIKELNPSPDFLKYYLKNKESDLLTFLLKLNSDRKAVDENDNFQGENWARWLFTRLMTKTQCVEIAIYSAEQVLYIYEENFDSDAPRNAIESAKKYLENPTLYSARAADAARAAYAARAARAADAARAARAADAAYAAYVAYAADVAYVAYAADYAAYAAYVAADARKKLQEKIIREAVRILDRDEI